LVDRIRLEITLPICGLKTNALITAAAGQTSVCNNGVALNHLSAPAWCAMAISAACLLLTKFFLRHCWRYAAKALFYFSTAIDVRGTINVRKIKER
jgi:hypothetical protein